MAFPEQLKTLRNKRNLSQRELGEKVGMGESTIQSYELGLRNPTMNRVKQLADFFGVSVNEMFGEKDAFLEEAKARYGSKGRRDAKELVEEVGALFTGGKLSEKDRDEVYRAFTEIYFDAKQRNKKYGKRPNQASNKV